MRSALPRILLLELSAVVLLFSFFFNSRESLVTSVSDKNRFANMCMSDAMIRYYQCSGGRCDASCKKACAMTLAMDRQRCDQFRQLLDKHLKD